jgi:hypothetical protein
MDSDRNGAFRMYACVVVCFAILQVATSLLSDKYQAHSSIIESPLCSPVGEITRAEMNNMYMRYKDNEDMIGAACGVLSQLGVDRTQCLMQRDVDGLTNLVRALVSAVL